MSVLAGFLLLTWGVLFAIGGAWLAWFGSLTDVLADQNLTAQVMDLVAEVDKQRTAAGLIVLMLGIMQMAGALGILAHRTWGRAFGIVLGLLGTIWGVAMVVSALRTTVGGYDIDGALADHEYAMGFGILVLVTYLFTFLAMYVGRRHFRRKGVS